MLIGSLVSRDFYHELSSSVYFQYPPLNDISCVYWYQVGCYSSLNTTFVASLTYVCFIPAKGLIRLLSANSSNIAFEVPLASK